MGSYITLRATEKYLGLFSKIILIGTSGKGNRYANEDTSNMSNNDNTILNALIGFENMTEIKKVKIPALEGKKVADALPCAKFAIVPNAPHVAFMNEPERNIVFSMIDDFLNRH